MGDKCSKIEENNKIFTPVKINNYSLTENKDFECKNEVVVLEENISLDNTDIIRTRSTQKLSDSEVETEENQIAVLRNDEDHTDLSDNENDVAVTNLMSNSNDIKTFKNQDIRRIRADGEVFQDPHFRPSVKIISSSINSDLASSLLKTFACKNVFDLSELDSLIKWERCSVISYHNRSALKLENEFVLNENGTPLPKKFSLYDYLKFFSIHDIFQGVLGDCFMIAAIMGITYNKDLLAYVIPKDNASKKNMRFGAYHFRFWRLGDWNDVVVDDYLPVNKNYDLFFTRNLTYQNEFWIPLFEKAVAKFVGNYELLHGGLLSNSSLFLSGGIHDNYYTDISIFITNNQPLTSEAARKILKFINDEYDNKPESVVPNVNELFEILRVASKRKDLIGCYQLNDRIAEMYGIFDKHQYLVSEVDQIRNIRYVKIHNPHNKIDDIKKKQSYQKLENLLKSMGLWTTYPGEFFMTYEDFIKCFEGITIVNLLPEKEISLDKLNKGLIKKSTLFTQWKIDSAKSTLYPKQHFGKKKQLKFEVSIKQRKSEYIIFSFCTPYLKTVPNVTLMVYKKDGNRAPKFMKNYFTIEFGGNHQQIFRLTVSPGDYIMYFDQQINKLVNEVDYCARIFFDKKKENDISIKFFEDQN